jgi:hypothetical protein
VSTHLIYVVMHPRSGEYSRAHRNLVRFIHAALVITQNKGSHLRCGDGLPAARAAGNGERAHCARRVAYGACAGGDVYPVSIRDGRNVGVRDAHGGHAGGSIERQTEAGHRSPSGAKGRTNSRGGDFNTRGDARWIWCRDKCIACRARACSFIPCRVGSTSHSGRSRLVTV